MKCSHEHPVRVEYACRDCGTLLAEPPIHSVSAISLRCAKVYEMQQRQLFCVLQAGHEGRCQVNESWTVQVPALEVPLK